MTEWTPPIETGLNGDRTPENDLGLFVDDLSDAHAPAVYGVKLSTPDKWETVIDRWEQHYDKDPPAYLTNAFDAHVVVYIGATQNLLERLHTHLDVPNQSAAITKVFPLHSLWDVWWFSDVGEAFDREHGIAMDLENKYPGLYAHSR